MARRKDGGQPPKETAPRHEIIQKPMDEVMHISMIPYAEHVILERALPRVEDGLKPVQRRILFTLNELGVTPDKPHKKCARIVGDVMGKYHPHGDSSIYEALVRMGQDFSSRYMLVDPHGNFGSVDGDGAAAMRYTEARMDKIAMEMLRDLDKDTVDFYPNYGVALYDSSASEIAPGTWSVSGGVIRIQWENGTEDELSLEIGDENSTLHYDTEGGDFTNSEW